MDIIIDSSQFVNKETYQPKKKARGIKIFSLLTYTQQKNGQAQKLASEVRAIETIVPTELLTEVIAYESYGQTTPDEIIKVNYYPDLGCGKTTGVWDITFTYNGRIIRRTITHDMIRFVAERVGFDLPTETENSNNDLFCIELEVIIDTKTKEAIKVVWETNTTGYTEGQKGNQYSFEIGPTRFFSESPAALNDRDCKHQRSIVESAKHRNGITHVAS
jgi:hypothetical protein